MFGEWLDDLESLEAISQDVEARQIFSHMAAMSQEGRLGTFLVELAGTPDLDDFTKGTLSEIARDEAFLLDGGRLPAPHAGSALSRCRLAATRSTSRPNLDAASSAGLPRACAVGFAIFRARLRRAAENGRSWIRTTDLRLIRAAL